jgi:tetratricopeptide (TPR) repeat protein
MRLASVSRRVPAVWTTCALLLVAAAARCLEIQPPPRPLEREVALAKAHLPAQVPTLRGNTDWIPLLTAGLRHHSSAVRARSAFVLGLVGDETAAEALSACLKDPVRDVRVHAGIALGLLGDARGLATCRAAVEDAEEWVRYYAVQALGRIAFLNSSQVVVPGDKKTRCAKSEFGRNPTAVAFAALKRCSESSDSPYIREAARLASERFRLKATALQPDRNRPTGGDHSPNRQGDLSADTLDAVFGSASDVLWLLADFPWHEGLYDDAIRLSQAVTFLDPRFTDAYEVAAWLLWSSDRPEEAMRWRIKGLRANPDVYDLYFDIGFWYFGQKDYAQAIRYLSKAATFECPETVRHSLAHALERGGRPHDALAVWEGILRENPDNAVARQNAERIRSRL